MNTMIARLVMGSLLAGVLLSRLYAQEEPVKITDVKLDKANLPGSVASPAACKELGEDWQYLEVKFSTKKPLMEEVQVKYYIEGYDSLKDNVFVVLVGEDTFLNVPKGDHFAGIYLDPMTLIRYGGKEGARSFKKNNAHVQILINGRMEAEQDINKKDDQGWFTQGQQVAGALVNLKDSPWWPSEARHYNRIKSRN